MAEEETTELVLPEKNPAVEVEPDGQLFTEEVEKLRDEVVTSLKQGDEDLVKQLRKRSQGDREHFDRLYSHSGQLLRVAGQYNRLENLIDLLPDIDENAVDSKGRTALHAAAETGNIEAVKMLLQRGAKWDIRDIKGLLPLHSALRSRLPNLEIVRLLVEKCANGGAAAGAAEVTQTSQGDGRLEWLYHPADDMGNTPLHVAATNITSDYEQCLLFMQEMKRFDPWVKNKRGDTPLHIVAKRGNVPLMEATLKIFYGFEKNVEIHPPNRDGDTLLDIAATSGFEDMVVLLFDYGADPRQGVLFKIVSESVRRPEMRDAMCRMYRLIMENVGKWSNGEDREEMVNIINTSTDPGLNDDRNIVEMAIDEGAIAMLKEIVHTDALYEFHSNGKYRVLLSHCLPSKERISLLERIVSYGKVQTGAQMLMIQPFGYLSSKYLWYSTVVYTIFFVFQLIYMIAFSYFCIPDACDMSNHFRLEAAKCNESSKVPSSSSTIIKNMVGFVVWPIFTLVFTVCLKLYQLGGKVFIRRLEILAQVFYFSFGAVVVAWFVALVKSDSYELYTAFTAFLFIFGWLQVFYYLSYLGEFYIFTNLIKAIIFNDVMKLASILIFVVVGFSFAIHSISQTEVLSSNRTLTETVYLTFASTLNLGDLFDDTMSDSPFAQSGGNLDLLRVVFIAYLIASFVILFNILIAMMSDTYQQNNKNAKAVWRFDVLKVSLALMIARKPKGEDPILPERIAGPIIRSLPESEGTSDDSDTTLLPF